MCLDANKVESIPDLFDKVVEGIKKDSTRTKSTKKVEKPKRKGDMIVSGDKTWERKKKMTKDQKKERISERIAIAAQKLREAQTNEG